MTGFIVLTARNGYKVLVNIDEIMVVSEQPSGYCMVSLRGDVKPFEVHQVLGEIHRRINDAITPPAPPQPQQEEVGNGR